MDRAVRDAIGSEPPWISGTNRSPWGSRPRFWLCEQHWRLLSTVLPWSVTPIRFASGGEEEEAVPRIVQAAVTEPEAGTGQHRR